ncbi:MAG TPA: hypothetical protein VF765_01955 [Polyangiaceae bacterium]
MSDIIAAHEPTPLKALRSTVVASGINVFRVRGLIDAYSKNLDAKSRDILLTTVAGTWLPVDLALAHFAAVDAIGLTSEQSFDIGATSARRFGETLWGTAMRMTRATGIDPWNVLNIYERLWKRSFDGGGFTVTRHGPKEAFVEIRSIPFARHAYFRDALRGAHQSLLALLARTVYVREVPRRTHPEGFTMRISWV